MAAHLRQIALAAVVALWATAGVTELRSPEAIQALDAIETGDYARAWAILNDPAASEDAEVQLLRARMTRDGQGVPRDNAEAYARFTAASVLDSEETAAQALQERRAIARSMTAAEIEAAEAIFLAYLDATFGHHLWTEDAEKVAEELEACSDQCGDEAFGVHLLGPGAAVAVEPLAELMTRDPFWLSRDAYANALGHIGIAAASAMCDVMKNQRELQTEGPYNIQSIANSVAIFGATTPAMADCLVDAFTVDYGTFAGSEMALELPNDADSTEMLALEIKGAVARAILATGDPTRRQHDRLAAQVDREAPGRLRLVAAYVVAKLYAEPDALAAVAGDALEGDDKSLSAIAIGLLTDMSDEVDLREQIASLRPKLEAVADGPDADLAIAAQDLLDRGE